MIPQINHPKPLLTAAYDIHPIFSQRWSPRSFTGEPIAESALKSIFEAARWTASAFNEQPWAFIYGIQGEDSFDKVLATLVPGNQSWASKAGALVVALAKTHYAHNGKSNSHAWYDLGQAVGNMVLQAGDLGVYAHQMAGFSPDKAVELLGIKEAYQPVAVIALGYLGAVEALPEGLQAKEIAPQQRKEQTDFVFEGGM